MNDALPPNLASTWLRLRNDATVEPLAVDETFWPRLMAGELGDFHHEFLVTMSAFEADWTSWEVHPEGDEIVCLIDGRVTFVLQMPAGEQRVELAESGSFVLVPRGTWHTAKVAAPSRMLFITAGEGTHHRPVGSL